MRCHSAIVCAAVIVAGALLIGQSDAKDNAASVASVERIAQLVSDLGDASYARRTEATRLLCAIGSPAAAALERVANGRDTEVALRAKAVLGVIGQLMFGGVEVRLALSKTKIAWDEPVDLTITMTNRSAFPARVPFEIDPLARGKVAGDGRQVGDMLDIAEYLRVRDARDASVALVVDDILGDEAVAKVVEHCIDVGPIAELAPSQSVSITARAFNRGWARYRLLDAGVYTIVLNYVPAWDDEVLAAQQAGRVVSNTATLTVTAGAPPAISRRGIDATVSIERDKGSFVARITNRSDRALLINTNFGASLPFARALWVHELAAERHEVPVERRVGASWHDFDPAKLVSLSAGESLTLARIGGEALRRVLAGAGAVLEGDRWTLHFEYDNLCDRRWQKRQGTALIGNDDAPRVFQELLPQNILTSRQVSERWPAPLSK